jgi:hypothetical protein
MVMWHYEFVLPASKDHVDVVCVQAFGPWEKNKARSDTINVRKRSPVHFFWPSFDLAVTRFSGRPAPQHPGGFSNMPD